MSLTKRPAVSASEAADMDRIIYEIVGTFWEAGIQCVICVSGRGYDRIAVERGDCVDAPELLARCYQTMVRQNARDAN